MNPAQVLRNSSRPCVRADLKGQIVEKARSGNSIKLNGIPGVGTTTLLQALVDDSTLAREFFIIYVERMYDPEGFAGEVEKALAPHGIPVPKIGATSLMTFLTTVRDSLNRGNVYQRILWIFDHFDQSFSFRKDQENTVLTQSNVTALHVIGDKPATFGMQIIVTYHQPVDPLINTGWYLNNLWTGPVDLLTESEARELTCISLRLAGRECNESDINRILEAGGRYPPLIVLLCELQNPTKNAEFSRRSRSFYRRLESHLKSTDEKLHDREGLTCPSEVAISALIDIAHHPIGPKELDDRRYDLARLFCYEERGLVKILAPGFGEFLAAGANDHAPVVTLQRLRELCSACGATLLFLFLVPIIYTLCLFLSSMALERPLFVREYDVWVFRPQYLANLWSYYPMPGFLTGPVVMVIAYLFDKLRKDREGPIFSWRRPILKGGFFQKIDAFFSWAPVFLVVFVVISAVGGLWTILSMDWKSPVKSDEAIVATIQGWRTARDSVADMGYPDILRRVYLNEAFISREVHPESYILVAPLTILLPRNFSSAATATASYAAVCWRSQIVAGGDGEVESRLLHVFEAPHAKEMLEGHSAMWQNDRRSGAFERVMAAAGDKVHIGDLGSDLLRLEEQSPDVAYLLYSSVRSGLAVAETSGDASLLDVTLIVTKHCLEKKAAFGPASASNSFSGRSR
jgi:hypothetical protein